MQFVVSFRLVVRFHFRFRFGCCFRFRCLFRYHFRSRLFRFSFSLLFHSHFCLHFRFHQRFCGCFPFVFRNLRRIQSSHLKHLSDDRLDGGSKHLLLGSERAKNVIILVRSVQLLMRYAHTVVARFRRHHMKISRRLFPAEVASYAVEKGQK